jgi:hypothetical protein
VNRQMEADAAVLPGASLCFIHVQHRATWHGQVGHSYHVDEESAVVQFADLGIRVVVGCDDHVHDILISLPLSWWYAGVV